ncbi:hypothetical protein PCI56_02800 [Plesiomonas shigelloides subsp. oncorhynchi]|nr:hypothetical protein [Plesiomonas shigelloides]
MDKHLASLKALNPARYQKVQDLFAVVDKVSKCLFVISSRSR